MSAVTVITPVCNGAPFIGATIDSLRAQSFQDFRLLVVDDASTDGTADVLRRYVDPRVRIIRSDRRLGAAEARNLAYSEVKTPFVAFCDGDDVAEPHRLARQMAFLERHAAVDLLATWVTVIDRDGRPTGAVWGHDGPELIAPAMLFGNRLATSTIVMRRAIVGDDRFDDRFCPVEDYEFWTRLLTRGRPYILHEALVRYRQHAGGITHTMQDRVQLNLQHIAGVQLSRLGIDSSASERHLHVQIGREEPSGTTAFVAQAESWLSRLRRANDASVVYERRAFDRVLARLWFKICDAAASGGCWDAWAIILRSRLTGAILLDPRLRTELTRLPWRTARGIMRHRSPTSGAAA